MTMAFDHDSPAEATGDASYECPRCGSTAAATYYGPCPSCCEQLRATFARGAREVRAEAYEPKMNVTPNAVALKDD